MTEHRTISATGGGTALTATAALITVPQIAGTGDLALTPRNFTTAVVAQYALNPRLTVLVTNDSLVTFTDDSVHAQDGLTTTDVEADALTAAPAGRIYVGAQGQFRGFAVDMDASEVNAVVSALTVFYWNGSAWTDASATDGTETGSDTTFGQDGNITFTVPATWAAATLFDIGDADPTTWKPDRTNFNVLNRAFYWLRLEVVATLTDPTSINQLRALNASTNYSEIQSGQKAQQTVQTDHHGIGCVEVLVDTGNGNMVADLAARAFV